MLLAMASGNRRHSRTGRWRNDVCREIACGLAFPAPRVKKLDGADHRPQLRYLSSRPHSRARLKSEAFAIPESQGDAVAEGVEKVVLAVAASVANAKGLDLVEQVIS